MIRFFLTHPLQTLFAVAVTAVVFFPLWLFVTGWAVALPWALFAAAALRLDMKSKTIVSSAHVSWNRD